MAFELPPYPYDLLDPFREKAERHKGGVVDLSVGTPCDPPPTAVVNALSESESERGYPKSVGSMDYLRACAEWLERRFGVEVPVNDGLAGCIGTKEFVASAPNDLRLANPMRKTRFCTRQLVTHLMQWGLNLLVVVPSLSPLIAT